VIVEQFLAQQAAHERDSSAPRDGAELATREGARAS
jgi:hypothetical protein